MVKRINLSGLRFGSLVAQSYAGLDSTNKTLWRCVCDCGGFHVVTALNLKTGNTKSCGCRKHLKGVDNPRTITDPERIKEKKRTLAAHRAWRNLVIKRNPACLKCGATDKLHAHHLEGYSDKPSLRINPDNGATLCADCHMQFHVKYGRRTGFSEANFCEFVVDLNEAPPKIEGEILDEAMQILALLRSDLQKAQHYLQKLIELESNK